VRYINPTVKRPLLRRFECPASSIFAVRVPQALPLRDHCSCILLTRFRAVPRNAGFESKTFAIVKARLVVSPEEEIEQGTLVIRDGLIVAAGKDVPIPPDAEVIEGAGLTVYPGFMHAGTSALLDPTGSRAQRRQDC